MKLRTRRVVSILSLLTLGACSGTYKHTLDFDPQEPLRVAVLPFVYLDDEGKIITDDGNLAVDSIPLVSSKLTDIPPELVRKAVERELAQSGLDLVPRSLIDVELPHHGFGKPDGSVDLEKLYATDARQICVHFIDCDAVFFGKVTNWDRTYYAVQSSSTVGVDFSLISAKDGKVLFAAKGEDTVSRGLTKGPTGYADLVLEPIKGLDSEIIGELARDVVKETLKPLEVTSRPEYLNAPQPVVYAASHDGAVGTISAIQPLIVVFFGSSDMSASFSIGDAVEGVPMIERSPGHYYGEYFPLPTDSFSEQPVTVYLTDKFGRVTSQRITKAPLSFAGTSVAN